ncbi:MAG: thiosulfate oxidation carrier complex protein SoxZ [Halieaceae bacterium]|jgi:sulfur-oxidizing protein SoxZ|nr:thiosulfate oxidation carrier complex protein SoxZ [Halieaceae bacterium]
MLNARISVPAVARRGEILTIKTLVSHPMETGFRRDAMNQRIPRNILTEFVCRLDDELVFRVDLHPAISANPYLAFHLRATRSGTLWFLWRDQNGEVTTERRELQVND